MEKRKRPIKDVAEHVLKVGLISLLATIAPALVYTPVSRNSVAEHSINPRQTQSQSRLETKVDRRNEVYEAPHFNIDQYMCAKYARLSAEQLSGVEYQPANAWDLGSRNQIIEQSRGDKVLDVYALEEEGKLEEGKSIVIFYNPGSGYNRIGRIGTHAAIYLGTNDKDEIIFAHQYGKTQGKVTLKSLKDKGLEPKQLISPKN